MNRRERRRIERLEAKHKPRAARVGDKNRLHNTKEQVAYLYAREGFLSDHDIARMLTVLVANHSDPKAEKLIEQTGFGEMYHATLEGITTKEEGVRRLEEVFKDQLSVRGASSKANVRWFYKDLLERKHEYHYNHPPEKPKGGT